MSKVARLPLALITAAIMLMTLVSTVAAAPAGGRGSATALANHGGDACVVLEGATAADLQADLTAQVDALVGEVIDATALADANALLELAADFGGTACVNLETLEVFVDVCIDDLTVLADVLADADFRTLLLGLLGDSTIVVDAALEAVLDPLLTADVVVGAVIGDIDFSELTTDALLDVVVLLDLALGAPVCVELMVDIGEIVVLGEEIICVEITAITVLDFDVVFGDAALLDDALVAELAALLVELDLAVGDVVCVVLVPVEGDLVVGPVVVIVGGDVNIGNVIVGDITIGDCSNAVITIVVNGENVETNVTQNIEGQCVDVVEAPGGAPAPTQPDDGEAPGTGGTPAPSQPMLPDTGVAGTDATSYGALILALVALASVGTLAAVNTSARRSR